MPEQRHALLTFSIGPVHTLIAQARRVADQWSGSQLLSHLIEVAITRLHKEGGEVVFPAVDSGTKLPPGLPNRFVCRVPETRAEEIAGHMTEALTSRWQELVAQAVQVLRTVGIEPSPAIWSETGSQADGVLDVAWSWVPEASYGEAARTGAEAFAAARMFRPFAQREERGEKCAVCGERTALPDGNRSNVRSAWSAAARHPKVRGNPLDPFLRPDQTRLCLVCWTKRIFPHLLDLRVRFPPFDKLSEESKYFAVVALDGDRMGQILGWSEDEVQNGAVEEFHRRISLALLRFTRDLRTRDSQDLNLEALDVELPRRVGPKEDVPPKLIYAGGEDVLIVCHPHDAIPVADAIRRRYTAGLSEVGELLTRPEAATEFTMSAAILFTHEKHPASLAFRDVDDLLTRKAKDESGRNSLAIRLNKRSGPARELAFRWDASPEGTQTPFIDAMLQIVAEVRRQTLASRQTFRASRDEETLHGLLTPEEWMLWATDRLSRGELPGHEAARMAGLTSPFLVAGKPEALRIARFLAQEVAP